MKHRSPDAATGRPLPRHKVSTNKNPCTAEQWRRAIAATQQFEGRDVVHQILHKRRGRPREFTADAWIAAHFLHSQLIKGILHETAVTETIRAWNGKQRAQVGLAPDRPVTYRMVEDATRKINQALANKAVAGWSLTRFVNAALAASIPSSYPATGAIALDSTDIETTARFCATKPVIDADPDGPPRPNQERGERLVRRADERTRRVAVKGADGRYVYTADPDARMGWRTAKNGRDTFCGYDAHVATDVRRIGGPDVPHIARSLAVAPAGTNKGRPGLDAVDAVLERHHVTELLIDRGYNGLRADSFVLPAWARGLTVIVDLHPTMHRGRHPGAQPGTVWIDGNLYSTCLPKAFWDLPAPDHPNKNDTDAQRQAKVALQAKFDYRAAWAFSPLSKRDRDGYQRFKGPAIAGTVRSPRHPPSMRLPHDRPTSACTPDKPCGCAITVTVSPKEYPTARNPMPWGTTRWARSYYRRNGIESTFSELKANRFAFARGSIRGFGLARHTTLLAFALAGLNITLLKEWNENRGQRDPWAVKLGEPGMSRQAPRRRKRRRTESIAPEPPFENL